MAVVAVFASWSAAQVIPGLPQCGVSDWRLLNRRLPADVAQEQCIENMLDLAEDLGCSPTDAVCLCSNTSFGQGIYDCTYESNDCASDRDKQRVVDAGQRFCVGRLGHVD